MPPFNTLPLPQEMLENLKQLHYHDMTAIQEKALPFILNGDDLIAQAKTGSGKTAAFGIGALLKLDISKFHPQTLIIAPTRELAEQVAKELRKLARFKHNIKILTLYGGTPMRHQITSLEHGAHIIVGTPGRIRDHLSKNSLNLRYIHTVILDEADRMLDMGFSEEIDKILSNTPKKRQTLLFSATFSDDIKALCHTVTHHAKEVKVEVTHDNAQIEECYYLYEKGYKFESLIKILQYHNPRSCIIFCNMKIDVDDVTASLQDVGFSALGLHGNLEQVDRDETLLQFANNSCAILVATDVAARGLDIPDVEVVINYDLPRNEETYTHRIGRTGRAGKSGKALSLTSTPIKETTTIPLEEIEVDETIMIDAKMQTICIQGGKKQKLRAGDILGALTSKKHIQGDAIGKIDIFPFYAYVAVDKQIAKNALSLLQNEKIKGKKFKAWMVY
jgi:ATP-independent RNA helicase DbpA